MDLNGEFNKPLATENTSGEAELSEITAEESELMDRLGELAEVKVRKKNKRRKELNPAPESLRELSGEDVLNIFDFLHRRYLSWMTEAESAKYSTLYKSARDEALKETLETYSELQKQNQELINKLEKLVNALEGRLQPTAIATETAQQIKKSLLDDPRIRTLIAIGLDAFLGSNDLYQKYRPLVICTLAPELCVEQQK